VWPCVVQATLCVAMWCGPGDPVCGPVRPRRPCVALCGPATLCDHVRPAGHVRCRVRPWSASSAALCRSARLRAILRRLVWLCLSLPLTACRPVSRAFAGL